MLVTKALKGTRIPRSLILRQHQFQFSNWSRCIASVASLRNRAFSSAVVVENEGHDAIQETLDRAVKAQDEFGLLSQEEADRVFYNVAKEANRARVRLAKVAFEETKMGCFEDKVIKNGTAW